jgi:nucleoside-diphosphate-sugar epimerase
MVESKPLPSQDLSEILERSRDDLLSLKGSNVFITGGTGFVGTWLVETLLEANQRLALDVKLTMLVRDPEWVIKQRPWIARDECVTLLHGDILTFHLSEFHDFIVHAATPTATMRTATEKLLLYETIVHGMEHVLREVTRLGHPRILFTSSGAVYGPQPPTLESMPESYFGGPNQALTAMTYHEAKRTAELRCALATELGVAEIVIGRLFAFIGPLLPLNAHFAAGNFIRDAMLGGPIVVEGDGTTLRSYQYAGDLVCWLLKLLTSASSGETYNVGSSEAVSISALAQASARAVGRNSEMVEVLKVADGVLPNRYVPDVSKAMDTFGLENLIDLSEGISRTIKWHASL